MLYKKFLKKKRPKFNKHYVIIHVKINSDKITISNFSLVNNK